MDMDTFIRENGISMDVGRACGNPYMNGMPTGSSHWTCTLRMGEDRLITPYSMGPALKGRPEVADVLDCLASDACCIDNATSFEEWASEYGYDPDSRKAEKVFNACKEQADALRDFLGDELLETLLYDVERL